MSNALLQQAHDAYRSGQLEQAEALAAQACDSDITDEQAVLMYSGLLLHRQATDDAENLLRTALAQGLESGAAQANLALCCSRAGEHAKAADLAKQATQVQPELISAWNALGAALLALKDFEAAEAAMLRGLEVHAGHPALSLLLAQAQSALNKSQQADVAFRAFDRSFHNLIRDAESLTLSGRLTEAEHRFRQLVATQPGSAAAHAGLGRLLLRLQRTDEAIQSLEEAIRLDSEDYTSQHFLSVARGQPVEHADPAYVRTLFDDYAEEFDQSLSGTLGYRIPEEIAKRLLDDRADMSQVLDLGCGTGLVADALNGQFEAIDGVDLSPEMLRLAEQRGVYRALHCREVVKFLAATTQQWSTAIAADVLTYIGKPDALLEQLATRIQSGGWFVFSIELSDGKSCVLNPVTGRFQHHPDGLDRVFKAHGFEQPSWTMTTIRQELAERIPGAIGLARRRNYSL